MGEIDLRIPTLRKGSFLLSLLEPRRRTEKALLAVVVQAYVEGVSTRKVDHLLKALVGAHTCFFDLPWVEAE